MSGVRLSVQGRVLIPLAGPECRPGTTHLPVEVNSMGDPALSASCRLLIVDDHEVVRAGFSTVLRRQVGLSVVGSVQSGEEALAFLARCPVDVVLLDLHMDGISGIDTLIAIQ